MNAMFFITNALLGVGLAMDAFSVSVANGLADPAMRRRDVVRIAGVFAFFQALMPMLGWICVHTIVEVFSFFGTLVPWIALGLLGYIGGKMIYDGVCEGHARDTRVRRTRRRPSTEGRSGALRGARCWCRAWRPRSTHCPLALPLPRIRGCMRWWLPRSLRW